MTQADSVHSTPPTSTSAELPTPAQETLTARLVAEAKKRARALKRLRKLRTKAADEIERLLAFLDAVDDTDVDSAVDDLACDDSDEGNAEPSLGWTEQEARWGRHAISNEVDAERDTCDDEPSLGAIEAHPNAYRTAGDPLHNQELWAVGTRDDREGDEHDGAEPDEADSEDGDHEPSLGSLEQMDQERWRHGETGDLEQGTTRNFERSTVYAGRSNVTNLDGSPVTRAQLRGGE